MASIAATRMMTVEEFERLPEPQPGWRLELRNGEIEEMPPVKFSHYKIQLKLRDLLAARLSEQGLVGIEFPFRPQGEHEWRLADVAFVVASRVLEITDNLHGSPDLVVEVLSPSNSAREMYAKERLYLETGAVEFWVVDSEIGEVRVASKTAPTIVYGKGELVPLASLGGESILVDEIFS